jgi:hypothetical protein
VQDSFVSFKFGDQIHSAITKSLIQDSFLYPALPLNRLVNLVALLAHTGSASGGSQPSHL